MYYLVYFFQKCFFFLFTTSRQRYFLGNMSVRFLFRFYYMCYSRGLKINRNIIITRLATLEGGVVEISGCNLTYKVIPYSNATLWSYFILQCLASSVNWTPLKKKIIKEPFNAIVNRPNLLSYPNTNSVGKLEPNKITSILYWGICGIFLNYLNKNIVSNVIRSSKIFNKGRYSRNRQTYRTGVYWCLYFNLLFILLAYYYCYKFSFNFGYLWYLAFFGLAPFITAKSFNLGLYSFRPLLLTLSTFTEIAYLVYSFSLSVLNRFGLLGLFYFLDI